MISQSLFHFLPFILSDTATTGVFGLGVQGLLKLPHNPNGGQAA